MSKDLYFEMADAENRKYYYQIIITNQNQEHENFHNNQQVNAITDKSIVRNQEHQEGCTESIFKK